MIQFGLPGSFYSLPMQQSSAPVTDAHTTNNPTRTAPSSQFAPGAPMAVLAPITMMTPAYMMAYPQMSGAAMAAGPGAGVVAGGAAGVNGGDSPTGATHVTANPTNATVQQTADAGGFGGYGGVGMYGGFAMPMMMMAPVFFQLGYPMVFQGSQAQPPAVDAAAPAVDGSVELPADEAVEIPQPVEQPPVNTDPVVIDVVPESDGDEQAPTIPPIVQLDNGDFAKYRSVEKSARQETSLSLALTTQDGDRITLDFSQIDSFDMSRFRGRTAEGDKVADETLTEDMERIVNMDVVGELSDDEKAAIDSVLAGVIEAVQSFFGGDVGQAVQKLKMMDFDGGQLAELSLNMSMSKSAEISKAYSNGGEALQDLMARDASVGQALEFIASEQKRLIDLAREVLDAPSAAGLVRSLMPPLMSDPFAELAQQVADNGVAEPGADDSDADSEEPEEMS